MHLRKSLPILTFTLLAAAVAFQQPCASLFAQDSLTNESPASTDAIDALQPLSAAELNRSLELGTQFLLNNQTPAGNFNYEFDFQSGTISSDDDSVRQAGALWGLTLLHQARPTKATTHAVVLGLQFYQRHSRQTSRGRMLIYPQASFGQTGMQALVCLALVDACRALPDVAQKSELHTMRQECLQFLRSLSRGDGHFHDQYDITDGVGYSLRSSPYVDGETLLALVKAARYTDERSVQQLQLISDCSEVIYRDYVIDAQKRDADSDLTKGCFQWYTMAMSEHLPLIDDPDIQGATVDRILSLSDWMIDTHQVLTRTRNTGYAYEGLLHAFDVARAAGRVDQAARLRAVTETGLHRLTTWQVGGPVPNDYLNSLAPKSGLAVGGVMNARNDARLRIDTTQHQMHAVQLALRFLHADVAANDPAE